jgi:hypothetical protein
MREAFIMVAKHTLAAVLCVVSACVGVAQAEMIVAPVAPPAPLAPIPPVAPVAPSVSIAPAAPSVTAPVAAPMTAQEIEQAQQAWGMSLVTLGQLHQAGGDVNNAALQLLNRLYAYDEGKVLFKPTKAATDEFRETKAQALSYFVKGEVAEDHGFALQPWSKVRFENHQMVINADTAEAMGDYFFTDATTGAETKVEFTFGYKRAKADGHLVIFLHHSSLPYEPKH